MTIVENIALILNYIMLGIIALCIILYFIRIIYVFYGFKKLKKEKDVDIYSSFCVLIPARNESKVIRNILTSLINQKYDMQKVDVYVIVEDEQDPTVEIVKEFGFNYYVRPDLENKMTKGWALDQCVRNIFDQGKVYDSFVIFDADNILQDDFLLSLNKARINHQIKVGFGNRQSTNYFKNVISMCSSIMFQMVNIFGNKGKSRFINKIILSGTGYFIDYDVIKSAGSFIWHGLCEDTELCIYLYAKGIKCGYVDEAIFFDEQPTSYKENLKQHTRWVWGNLFADMKQRPLVMKSFLKDKSDRLAKMDFLVSNVPIGIMIIYSFCNAFIQFCVGIAYSIVNKVFLNKYYFIGLGVVLIFYLIFTIIAFLVVIINRRYLTKAKKRLKVVSCLVFFFYMADFVTGFVFGLSKKNRTWKEIRHSGK